MLRAYKIKQYPQHETEYSEIVLAVQEQSCLHENSEASLDTPKEASRGVLSYRQHFMSARGIKEASIEQLDFSHSHHSVVCDAQICGPCENLQNTCREVGTVMCVFPDVVQDLISTIITSQEVDQAEAASIGAKLVAEGCYTTNSVVGENALCMLCNSTLWACGLGVLTAGRPASVKLFVNGIEISLESFVQGLKRFSSRPGSKAQLELEKCGPLSRICQLDSLRNVPVEKSGLIAEEEVLATFTGAKFNTFPRPTRPRTRYPHFSRSDDLTVRGGKPDDVPRA